MTRSSSSPRASAVAMLYGVLCHSCFALAVGLMIWSVYHGLQTGLGTLRGKEAVLANSFLVLQFPLLHSYLLSKQGRRLLKLLAPRQYADDLVTTLFVITGSLQLLLVFLCWSPSGIVWWEPHHALRIAWALAHAACWLLLLKSMSDAGLEVQLGYLGWLSLWRGRAPRYRAFEPRGTLAFCRQPIYGSFALILWSAPVWTPDHLALAAVWSLYCIVAPVFKERRYLTYYGAAFAAYQRRVPYLLPRFSRFHHLTEEGLH